MFVAFNFVFFFQNFNKSQITHEISPRPTYTNGHINGAQLAGLKFWEIYTIAKAIGGSSSVFLVSLMFDKVVLCLLKVCISIDIVGGKILTE